MQSLGIDILFKGSNFLRLLGGLWVAVRISLISVAISIVLGLLVGALMTRKQPVLKAVLRVYLEIVRIMPQMVLLFLVYFGTTRVFGWNLEAEAAAIFVFSFWGVAEMGDLVRGSLISIPKIQYESAMALGLSTPPGVCPCDFAPDHPAVDSPFHQPDYPYDKNHQSRDDDWHCGGAEGGSADH